MVEETDVGVPCVNKSHGLLILIYIRHINDVTNICFFMPNHEFQEQGRSEVKETENE